MDNFLYKFGVKLRMYRNVSGLRQEMLAEYSDLSIGAISSIENGKSFPRYENILKLCKALRIEPTDLLNVDSVKFDKNSKELQQIILLAKNLSVEQQMHIIKILETFK